MTTAPGQPFPPYTPVHLDTESLAGTLLDHWHRENPAVWQSSSAAVKAELRDIFRDSVRALEPALATRTPAIFTDYARWVKGMAAHRSFPPDFPAGFLRVLREVLPAELPGDYRENAKIILEESRAAWKKAPGTAPPVIRNEEPLAPEAREYLESLLAGNSREADRILAAAMKQGIPVRDLYLHILQPALRETGRLWQIREISVGQEHFVSATVTAAMARLQDPARPAAGESGRSRGSMVAATIGKDPHDIGVRIVAEFFAMDGWETYLTGADTPPESIIAAVRERKAGVIAISCTMAYHLGSVEYLIRSLRADPATKKVTILVGGHPFLVAPGLGKQLGADAVARDAAEAVAVADRLVAQKGRRARKKRSTRT